MKKTTYPTIHQSVQITQSHIIYTSSLGNAVKQQQVELPEGTITSGRINNKEQFQSSVSQLFTSLNLKNQTVILSLPEHQTFVKTVAINDLNSDIHESVIWKVQQFLPLSAEQMQLDWGILPTDPAPPYQVQVAALPKEIIQEYLEVISPFVQVTAIETPSLTLSRLAQDVEHPCLLIDADTTTTLVVSQMAGSVDLTSVTATDSISSIAQDMLGYFQSKYELPVEKVFITGANATNLQSQFQGAQLLPSPINNPAQAIAYTLAEKPMAPPEDPHTLNLAPRQYQQDFTQSAPTLYYKRAVMVSLLFAVILNLLIAGFTTMTWLKNRQLEQDLQANQPSLTQLAQLENTSNTQNQLQTILAVAPERTQVTILIDQLKQFTQDVAVTNIILDMENQTMSITGLSPSQEVLLGLRQSLEQSENFNEVRLPLSVFEKRQDIPFTITSKWQPPQETQ